MFLDQHLLIRRLIMTEEHRRLRYVHVNYSCYWLTRALSRGDRARGRARCTAHCCIKTGPRR